jgi:hypothetical protein
MGKLISAISASNFYNFALKLCVAVSYCGIHIFNCAVLNLWWLLFQYWIYLISRFCLAISFFLFSLDHSKISFICCYRCMKCQALLLNLILELSIWRDAIFSHYAFVQNRQTDLRSAKTIVGPLVEWCGKAPQYQKIITRVDFTVGSALFFT